MNEMEDNMDQTSAARSSDGPGGLTENSLPLPENNLPLPSESGDGASPVYRGVKCPVHHIRYLDLSGSEEMCPECRVMNEPLPLVRICCLSYPDEKHLEDCSKLQTIANLKDQMEWSDLERDMAEIRLSMDICAEDAEDPIASGIGVVIGAASVCWQYPDRSGIFDSDRASALIRLLRQWIADSVKNGEAEL